MSGQSLKYNLAPIFFGLICVGMGQTVVFAILPMLGRALGLDQIVFAIPFTEYTFAPKEMAITSLSAMSALIFAVSSPFWGRLSDRVGRKPIILCGLFGYAIGALIFNMAAYAGLKGVAGGAMLYLLLMISRGLNAVLSAGTNPSASAYIVDVTDLSQRVKQLGKLGAFMQIGSVIGPVLAWFASISFLAPLYIQAGLMTVAGLLVIFYLPPTTSHIGHSDKYPRLKPFDRRIRKFVLIGFAMYSMLAMVQQTLGFYFQDTLHLTGVEAAQTFSMAMMISSLAILVAQFGIVQRFAGPPVNLVRIGLPFSVVGYLIIANASTLPMLLVAMGFFGLGTGIVGPGYIASATLVVESREQGALAGILGSAAGMGFVFGPIAGGYFYSLTPTLPYWFAAGVIFLVALMLWRPVRTSSDVAKK